MTKESPIFKVCDFITKYSIYALVFLAPLFFLPQTAEILDFNKQALLFLLVFVSLFATMVKILVVGKFEINKSPMHIVAGVLFLAYLLSTIFSVYKHGSFWGVSQQTPESMIMIVGFLLLYFLVSNIFVKKDIITLAITLSFSAIVAELVGVLQLFGLFIMPFDFAKSVAFNTIGSVGSLGLFTAVLLPLAITLLIIIKKWWRILFILQIIISALILILINYPVIWWVVIVGSALTLTLVIIKRNLFDVRWLALPTFFLVVALFFSILNPQINWLPQKANEVFLSEGASFDIAKQTIKANPIFGSGPGTFAYDFSKFKSADFSNSSLWNITFNKPASKVVNSLATTGIFGFLAMLALMAFAIFYGIKFFASKKEMASSVGAEKSAGQIYNILLLGLLVAVVEQSVAYFFYSSNVTLDFVYFFSIAALVGIISTNRKEYALKSASSLSLIITLIFTVVFILGMGLLILSGQRYVAEVYYYKGLSAYQADKKADGLKNLVAAANLNHQSDLYFRQLSQAYLLEFQTQLQNANPNPTDQEKTNVQTLVSNSINAGKIATDINPQDVNNWSSRGYVYQNLIGILADASTWAINSYDEALKLDPNSPYLFAQEGNVYLSEAVGPSSGVQKLTADQKNQLLVKAQTQLEKSIALNQNYSDALYSLGIVYDSLGQKDKAIEVFTKLQQLYPTNTDIPKVLNNLKAGKPILQVATPPAANPPSETSGAVKK